MRTHGALLTAGLFGSFSLASRAPVYVSGPSIEETKQTGNDAPSISFSNAQPFFAQRVGVAEDYSLDGVDDTTLGLLNQVQGSQQRLFASESDDSSPRRTFVIVEGVDQPEDLLGSRVQPCFFVEKAPSISDSLHLVSTLLDQDREQRGAREACGGWATTTEIKDSVQGGFSAVDPLGTCNLGSIQSSSWWKALSMEAKFDLLNAPASDLMSQVYEKRMPAWRLDDVTGVFHIWTLHDLAAKHGLSSSIYTTARATLQASLTKLLASSGETTIVLFPYTRGATPKRMAPSSRVGRRADSFLDTAVASESSTPSAAISFAASSEIPRTTIPFCYIDEDSCVNATSNCTGNGACSLKWTERDSDEEMGAECWACACTPTILVAGEGPDGAGRKTVYWGGPACQKKDISVPFWLFAGFGIAMASAVSYGIGMLYSMGEADLPSVLGSGVASVGARAK